ncbi:hypothetical protein BGZ65_002584 [Modicella reniformis]|uniref:Uncharacterized protein n=1 Tax=Modicella reniformis TaxID=1440133 RepID=A0A9P6MI71_9FUNG|nr:hypothetical protein BGZ65_002584 [Modicella reniformis]
MEDKQRRYLRDTRDKDISLKQFGIKTTAEQLDAHWTGAANHYLQTLGTKGMRVLNRFSHLRHNDGKRLSHRYCPHLHARSLRPLADQVKAVAEEATDELEQSVGLKRTIQQGSEGKKRKPNAAREPSGSGQQTDNDCGADVDAGTRASDLPASTNRSNTIPATQVYFDPDKARPITLILAGCDIGPSFKLLQREAAPFVNDKIIKVSISNKLHLLMSIWDVSIVLPGMTRTTHQDILTEDDVRLCLDLSYELVLTGRVRSRALEREQQDDILLLFQKL